MIHRALSLQRLLSVNHNLHISSFIVVTTRPYINMLVHLQVCAYVTGEALSAVPHSLVLHYRIVILSAAICTCVVATEAEHYILS